MIRFVRLTLPNGKLILVNPRNITSVAHAELPPDESGRARRGVSISLTNGREIFATESLEEIVDFL
jgi:uncharacterized protein YlzI (FlbEa/FlbD family)